MRNDHGLFVNDLPNGTVQVVGYIFSFQEHGAFAPSGKVGELTNKEIDIHNDLLAKMELEALKENNRGVLYLRRHEISKGCYICSVTQWNGNVINQNVAIKRSHHNFAGKYGRTDVWFTFDGSQWHGVNIGNNDILRVRRNKKES